MIDKHVIDEMWEFLYTVVSSNHSKYTSQRITDLNPLGSTEFGHDSDGLKPMVKKTTKTKQKSQQHIQDYTGTVHFQIHFGSFEGCCLSKESDCTSVFYLKKLSTKKAFLKEKIKSLGRMPTTDENKKFFQEFKNSRGMKGTKRKNSIRDTDSEQSTPKRVKTISQDSDRSEPRMTARNEELESATQNLEKLLDE